MGLVCSAIACGGAQIAGPLAQRRAPAFAHPAVEREIEAYLDAALFPDERRYLEDPACRIEAVREGVVRPDDEIVSDCASRGEGSSACAHACIARARGDAARAAYAQSLFVTRELIAAMRASGGACDAISQRLSNSAHGDPARELIQCLGLGLLPAGAEPNVTFETYEVSGRDEHGFAYTTVRHRDRIDRHHIVLVLLPGGPDRELTPLSDENPARCHRVDRGVCIRIGDHQ
jgi:hypothetical protein